LTIVFDVQNEATSAFGKIYFLSLTDGPTFIIFCLRRTVVTDSKRKVQGTVVVERIGGDMLVFDSPELSFNTSISFSNVSRRPLVG
jgi:hypothetical protein